MYEIISIANHHQFDGITLSEKDFTKLLDVLELGTFFQTAEVLKDGKKELYSNQHK